MSTNSSNTSTNTAAGPQDNDSTAGVGTVGAAGTAASHPELGGCKRKPLPASVKEPAKGSIFMPTKETGPLADGTQNPLENWNFHNLT